MRVEERRARALIRDNGRLRRELERHRDNRFDLTVLAEVHEASRAVLETLDAIAADDGLWSALGDRAEALADSHIEALGFFDDELFGALLSASGYSTPPPPRVEDIIAATRDALGHALEVGVSTDAVDRARVQLSRFLYRCRRQLGENEEEPTRAAVTSLGARVANVATAVTPVVVGAGVGATIEALLPSGMGIAAGGFVTEGLRKMIETAGGEVAERGVDWALGAAIGTRTAATGELDDDPDEDGSIIATFDFDRLVEAHFAKVGLLVRDGVRLETNDRAVRWDEAFAHLKRVQMLVEDHDGPNSISEAASFASHVLQYVQQNLTQRRRYLEFVTRVLAAASPHQDDGETAEKEPFGGEKNDFDFFSRFDPFASEVEVVIKEWQAIHLPPQTVAAPTDAIGVYRTSREASGEQGQYRTMS